MIFSRHAYYGAPSAPPPPQAATTASSVLHPTAADLCFEVAVLHKPLVRGAINAAMTASMAVAADITPDHAGTRPLPEPGQADAGHALALVPPPSTGNASWCAWPYLDQAGIIASTRDAAAAVLRNAAAALVIRDLSGSECVQPAHGLIGNGI